MESSKDFQVKHWNSKYMLLNLTVYFVEIPIVDSISRQLWSKPPLPTADDQFQLWIRFGDSWRNKSMFQPAYYVKSGIRSEKFWEFDITSKLKFIQRLNHSYKLRIYCYWEWYTKLNIFRVNFVIMSKLPLSTMGISIKYIVRFNSMYFESQSFTWKSLINSLRKWVP